MKLVSVIIPLYNTEKYIGETLTSVQQQSYNNLEILVIDDGSTDGSAAIVKRIAESDSRIHYIFQENCGVSIARNNGIERSTGFFVFFLDADDVWKPNHIQQRIGLLDSKNEMDWSFGALELIDENSSPTGKLVTGNDTDILKDLLSWNGNVITAPSSLCVKRHVLNNLNFDPKLSTAADQDFAIRLAAQYRGCYSGQATVQYRVLPDSMSRNLSLMEKDHIRVFQKAEQNNFFHSYVFKQKCFGNLYWILAGSWWKNGGNKMRGIYFIILALLCNPLSIKRIFGK